MYIIDYLDRLLDLQLVSGVHGLFLRQEVERSLEKVTLWMYEFANLESLLPKIPRLNKAFIGFWLVGPLAASRLLNAFDECLQLVSLILIFEKENHFTIVD